MINTLKELGRNLLTSLLSVIPIALVILIYYFVDIVPLRFEELIVFIIGIISLFIGAGIFSFGADVSMTKMGNIIGNSLTKHKKIILICFVVFFLGFIITLAEPDLELLISQLFNENKWGIIAICGIGIGAMFLFGALRIVFNLDLRVILLGLYGLFFALAVLLDNSAIPFVLDSGGVVTGSVSVPFIISLGIGLSSIKRKDTNDDASFGFTGIVSVGPLLVLALFFIIDPNLIKNAGDSITLESVDSISGYIGNSLLETISSTAISIAPIALCFFVYDFVFVKSNKKELIHIFIGLIITFIGLVFFLSGANFGLIPIGQKMGVSFINNIDGNYLALHILLFSIVIGAAIVFAEPSIKILGEQVETISDGVIRKRSLMIALALGNILALLLSLYKVIYNFNFLYIVIPGYILVFILTFIVPKRFVGVAFDSGGIASGTMTAAFITPIAVGMSVELAKTDSSINPVSLSFGVVAIVALIPLLVVQILGLNAMIKTKIIYHKARLRVKDLNENQVIHIG